METKMILSRKTVGLAAALVAFLGLAGTASASTWTQNHQRRAEVNHRLARQNHRIHHEVREGEITRRQANKLHAQDHFIRHEERFAAGQHGGHITRAEQRSLNQQENGVSREIGR
jgi:Flp pilus assembly protein TadB